jgi:hypothetical protein
MIGAWARGNGKAPNRKDMRARPTQAYEAIRCPLETLRARGGRRGVVGF